MRGSATVILFGILLFGILSSNLVCASLQRLGRFDSKMNSSDSKLVFASVIFRHGDRNVDQIYPNDPYKDEKYWPEGLGQLTKEEIRRQYRLGQYLRRRYNDLFGEKYSFKKVYVQSSDYDRTLMSAQANLAGLFMPTPEEEWNDEIMWQPIPVHTLPRNLDILIAIERDCPKYKNLLAKYQQGSRELKRIFTEYADQISYWSEMSGKNLTGTYDIYWLYNTLDIEREQNKKLPKWGEKAIEKGGLMEYIATFDFTLYADTPNLARFASGFLIKEILEHFSQKANSTLVPDRSLWMYSGHDFSIVNALNSLGLYDKIHIPAYASSLHFELYKSHKNEYYVQVFYRKSEEEYPSPMPLNIPGCGEKCPLNEFIDLCQKFIPQNDVEFECRL